MDIDNVITAKVSQLIDVLDEQPTQGSRVLALQHGGCLVSVVWSSNSMEYYDAWCSYPRVPASVRKRQVIRMMGGDN